MTSQNKKVDFCLLIPCYNNLEGLIFSLETVDYYSERLIIVVVDDGSKIPVSVDAIKSAVKKEFPFIILRNDSNNGVADALNKGLKWIESNTESKYIARLDCGDLCAADRFYKQMDYLNNHPDTGLLGSWCIFKSKQSSLEYQYKTPTEEKRIRRAMHFRNVFIHPTVIFKTSLLEKTGYYPYDFKHSEDYAFFWKLVKIAPSNILSEFLVTSEINEEGISLKNRHKQLSDRVKIISKYGTNPILKIIGIVRTNILHLVPQRLVLSLKSSLNYEL